MLSILIPTYNDDCSNLVADLTRQAQALGPADWEIVVADDGSTDSDVIARNAVIGQQPGCRLVRSTANIGRAAIRNLLVAEAKGDLLLFVDADMHVASSDFLQAYLAASKLSQVVYGGYAVEGSDTSNLRFVYENKGKRNHTPEMRSLHPYTDFHTSNFLVPRAVMQAIPFDERFRHYGYEDVFFGKELQRHGISITHIDNPVVFSDFETNADFLRKTEEGMRTLRLFSSELQGFSALLPIASALERWHLKPLTASLFRLTKKALLANLLSAKPSLLAFQIYKLGYYLSCT